jgi:hypothetical protein
VRGDAVSVHTPRGVLVQHATRYADLEEWAGTATHAQLRTMKLEATSFTAKCERRRSARSAGHGSHVVATCLRDERMTYALLNERQSQDIWQATNL